MKKPSYKAPDDPAARRLWIEAWKEYNEHKPKFQAKTITVEVDVPDLFPVDTGKPKISRIQ